jgi:trypsin
MVLLGMVITIIAAVVDIHTTQAEHTVSSKIRRRRIQQNYSTNIVGGQLAPAEKYPYFVSWSSGSCGASLIWKDVLLSAAHCADISSNQVTIGSTTSNTVTPENDVETRSIVARRIHPNYNSGTVANDFVLLKISETSTKTPVTLPLSSSSSSLSPSALSQNPNSSTKDFPRLPVDGTELTVMGFGTTSEGSSTGSTSLREVNITTVPHEICSSQYGGSGSIIEDVMFCAGTPTGGKDSWYVWFVLCFF